jgi:hypothetical protein
MLERERRSGSWTEEYTCYREADARILATTLTAGLNAFPLRAAHDLSTQAPCLPSRHLPRAVCNGKSDRIVSCSDYSWWLLRFRLSMPGSIEWVLRKYWGYAGFPGLNQPKDGMSSPDLRSRKPGRQDERRPIARCRGLCFLSAETGVA